MTEGTGPGRGFPWWRRPVVLRHRISYGLTEREPADRPREGRLVKRISEPRS